MVTIKFEGFKFDEESGTFKMNDIEMTAYELMVCKFEIGNGIVKSVNKHGNVSLRLSEEALERLQNLRAQSN
ncbi:MAG: hypothetical protein ACM3S2_03730 [Ignavibacteriales bacterium]